MAAVCSILYWHKQSTWWMCKFKNFLTVKVTLPWTSLISKQFWSFFLHVFRQWDRQCMLLLSASQQKGSSLQQHSASNPPYSKDPTPCDLGFLKAKMANSKHFESVQATQAAMTVWLKTLRKEKSRAASESGKRDGMRVFKRKGRFLRTGTTCVYCGTLSELQQSL